jgi:DNA-binding IclR family transcriptional regulator
MPSGLTAGLSILTFLARQPHSAPAREIAKATGIPRTTAYRLLDELVSSGWLIAEGSPTAYALSTQVAELGVLWIRHQRVREICFPFMVELSKAVRCVTYLAIYDRGFVFYIDAVRVMGDRVLASASGQRTPAPSTAAGKILLAFRSDEEVAEVAARGMPKMGPQTKLAPKEIVADIASTRHRGVAISEGEFHRNAAGISAPIFDDSGEAVLAIGISTSPPLTEDFIASVLPRLQDIANEASAALGYRNPFRHFLD